MRKKIEVIDIQAEMRAYIKREHGTQANAAIVWKCQQPFISDVLRGERQPTARMLADAGFRKMETCYERVKK